MSVAEEQISMMVQAVINGEASACEVFSTLKNLEKQIESGLKVIKDEAMNEAREFNKGENYFGGMWTFSNTGDTLNYLDDPSFKEIKQKLSDRQNLLKIAFKAYEKGQIFVNEQTGETIPIVSIKKVSEETIKFTSK